jgi:hypothetical protein
MKKILSDFLLLHILTRIEKERLDLKIHHTSMIHNATTVKEHAETLVKLTAVRKRISYECDTDLDTVQKKLISVADEYYSGYSKLMHLHKCIRKISIFELKEKIDEIEFIELNRRDEILEDPDVEFEFKDDFEQEIYYPENGNKSYIVTGGSRIARGLTLQGLTITCFTRRAVEPNFDTMLQMARWCGYREGYGDLVRIMTTLQIVEDYQNIFEAEAHMRMQIEHLTDNSDPVNDVIWIKKQNGLNISGRLPTKQFRQHISGFNEFVAEYTWTYHPPELVSNGKNNAFTNAFFKRLFMPLESSSKWALPPKSETGYKVSLDVKYNLINRFIEEYCENYPPKTVICQQRDTLLSAAKVLNKYASWNVAIAEPQKKPITPKNHNSFKFNLSKRTPSKGKISQVYSSFEKASQIDLQKGQTRTRPLLIIYLANHELKYSDGTSCYDGATNPVVMFGIICPVSAGDINKYIGGHREGITVKPWWMK